MNIIIHKGFLDSLENLAKSDRKRTLAFLDKIQEGSSALGLRQHQVVKGFLSLSPTMDIRVIAQQISSKLIMLHVDRHDEAYKWAERHALLANTATDTYELVTIANSTSLVESGEETSPTYGEELTRTLRAKSIPEYIRVGFESCSSEDDLLSRLETISPEWQEAIIQAITSGGKTVDVPQRASSLVRVLAEDGPLSDALAYPIEAWRVFLHPRQQDAVTDLGHNVTCVVGGPGTGKSIVCAHRAIFLSKQLEPNEVVVVFTYSPSLINDLRDMLTRLDPNQHNIDHKIWIMSCNDLSTFATRQTSISIEGNEIILRRANYRRRVRAIVIDEFQDSPRWFVDWVIKAKENSACEQITVALDTNQSIFRIGHEAEIKRLLTDAKTYYLSYCYRMTKPLLDNAFSVLSRYAVEYADVMDIGIGLQIPIALLGGPKVRYIAASNIEQIVTKAKESMHELEQRYSDNEGLVLVHLQYWDPSFAKSGKVDPLAEALKADEQIGKYYRFASLTKGKEYFAGVIVCPDDFMARPLGGRANLMRLNTLYVALTRIRDELVFVYADKAPVLPYLPLE